MGAPNFDSLMFSVKERAVYRVVAHRYDVERGSSSEVIAWDGQRAFGDEGDAYVTVPVNDDNYKRLESAPLFLDPSNFATFVYLFDQLNKLKSKFNFG